MLAPLGMTRTGYYGDAGVVPGGARGYSADEQGITIRAPYASMSGPGAAGALSSTVDDLLRFERGLASGRLLPEALARQMTAAHKTAAGQDFPYGFGVMLGTVRGDTVQEHNGGIEGFAAQLAYFPKQDVTVVVLTNTDAGQVLPRSLAHRLGALAIGRPYRDFEDAQPTAATLATLAGGYEAGPHSVRIVSVVAGKIFVQRDRGPKREVRFADDDLLYFPHDRIDFFHLVRDPRGSVVAVEFHPDGAPAGRPEPRIE